MSKHVIDGPKNTETSRVSTRFSRIEGDRLPRPQTLTIQKRPRTTAGKRLAQYLSIERRESQ